jgi:DNA-directed RNA polymerase specialized sigma24 family protein
MGTAATDEELLIQQDAASFELFYGRYFERLLTFFAWHTRDAARAADLTAETFAAALAARRRYRRRGGRADSWLFAIAYHKLADSQRRGCAEDRARRRLGSSASSSHKTTSHASIGWASRARWPSWCASCRPISRRRSRRMAIPAAHVESRRPGPADQTVAVDDR